MNEPPVLRGQSVQLSVVPITCRSNHIGSIKANRLRSGEPSLTFPELLAVAGRVCFLTSGPQPPAWSRALIQVNLGLFHEQVNKAINSMLFFKQNKTTLYVFTKANYERWKTCFLLLYRFSWAQWHVWHPSSPDRAPSVLLLIHCGDLGHAGRSPPRCSVSFSGVSGQIPLAPYATCNCELDFKVQQEHII